MDPKEQMVAAAQEGELDTVKLLIEEGENVNLANNEGYTPLYAASEAGQVEVVELLLGHGANVEMRAKFEYSQSDGMTPLFVACEEGHLEVVKILVERGGANINLENELSFTALQVASREGHLEVVKYLLDNGALTDLADNDGITPLSSATAHGHLDIVLLLLERGAGLDVVDKRGYTALYGAAHMGFPDVVEALLDAGANIDKTSKIGKTALFGACDGRRMDVIKMLLERGASVEVNPEGLKISHTYIMEDQLRTFGLAFENSFWQDRLDVSELMLNAWPKVIDHVRREPILHLAVRSEHSKSSELIQLLIDNGFPVDNMAELDRDLTTPLQLAVMNKKPSKVWLLALHGAYTTSFYYDNDFNSKSMMDLCDGHKETEEALLHYWTPQTHRYHPKWVKDAILCVLLVSKQQQWPFDKQTMLNILSLIAYDWYTPNWKPLDQELVPAPCGDQDKGMSWALT